jgi:hypothetical protein
MTVMHRCGRGHWARRVSHERPYQHADNPEGARVFVELFQQAPQPEQPLTSFSRSYSHLIGASRILKLTLSVRKEWARRVRSLLKVFCGS